MVHGFFIFDSIKETVDVDFSQLATRCRRYRRFICVDVFEWIAQRSGSTYALKLSPIFALQCPRFGTGRRKMDSRAMIQAVARSLNG